MGDGRPKLDGVLETVLYYEDEAATERFYSEIMGMRLLAKEPGRDIFYRAGASVFLLFHAAATRVAGKLPPHGATGSIHTCFRVPPEDYEAWKVHLETSGVPVIREVRWPNGLSFYFQDPSGNLLEIANADIWPE